MSPCNPSTLGFLIGLGVLLGALALGLTSWAVGNYRARREREQELRRKVDELASQLCSPIFFESGLSQQTNKHIFRLDNERTILAARVAKLEENFEWPYEKMPAKAMWWESRRLKEPTTTLHKEIKDIDTRYSGYVENIFTRLRAVEDQLKPAVKRGHKGAK